MPQPPISIHKYLTTPLPPVREAFPPGGGATGVKEKFTGQLEGVSVIDGFKGLVGDYIKSLPSTPLPPHPAHPFPTFVSVSRELSGVVKSAQDVQQYLRRLPLSATTASLSALKAREEGVDLENVDLGGAGAAGGGRRGQALDRAGYESDGGEEPSPKKAPTTLVDEGADTGVVQGVKSYGWRFSKSPLGSGEFLLTEEGKGNENKVALVVRTINSSAFSKQDWEDFVVEGPYTYNTNSKASWYWSRKYGASVRLNTHYFVFTDYQRWAFGVFTEDRKHAQISPVMELDARDPTVLEALLYWTRSALGEKGGYKAEKKDVSSLPSPYADIRRRRSSVQQGGLADAADESDIEEA
jgi:hypothetical protein